MFQNIFSKVTKVVVLTGVLVSTSFAWELQWYGQSAIKITSPKGKVLLLDPFITKNPKTPKEFKDLTKLGKLDLLLLTHAHGDHIGDTEEIVKNTNVKVALNADFGQTLATLGVVVADRLIRFNKSGPIEPIEGIKITMVHAEHSSEFVYTDPKTNQKSVYPGGEPAGFIIELENGFKIYHAGDTGVFSDMEFIGSYYKPNLALLPIGGHFTMDPAHAAYSIKKYLKTPHVIPIHYGTFPLLKGTPQELIEDLKGTNTKVTVLKEGEIIKF